MTRLTRYTRGLLVSIAALALTAGAAFAAGGFPPESSGHPAPVVKSDTETPDVDQTETPEVDQVEAPETETPDSQDAKTDAARRHNHGWFVSQAAHLPTPAGFANHGAYVSSIAHGTDGKPAAAANGAAKSAGKAKGHAAKTSHAGGSH